MARSERHVMAGRIRTETSELALLFRQAAELDINIRRLDWMPGADAMAPQYLRLELEVPLIEGNEMDGQVAAWWDSLHGAFEMAQVGMASSVV